MQNIQRDFSISQCEMLLKNDADSIATCVAQQGGQNMMANVRSSACTTFLDLWKKWHWTQSMVLMSTTSSSPCSLSLTTTVRSSWSILQCVCSLDYEKTCDFASYFQREYARRPEPWACSYRIGLRVHHNMHLEAMHRVLKHVHTQAGRCATQTKAYIHFFHALGRSFGWRLAYALSLCPCVGWKHNTWEIWEKNCRFLVCYLRLNFSNSEHSLVNWSPQVIAEAAAAAAADDFLTWNGEAMCSGQITRCIQS